MTYELAKQLKDAAFPQDPNVFDTESHGYWQHIDEFDEATSVYIPTLSELVEAIVRPENRNYFSLSYDEEWSSYEEPNEDGPWAARYYPRTPEGFVEVGCKTPDEAVAKLWLALNK